MLTASRSLLLALAVLGTTTAAGCGSRAPADDGAEDPLTSATARARSLVFDGYIYVDRGASDDTILAAVRAQTQTAFGALRNAEIGVNSRELKDVDPSTFKKKDVTVGETGKPLTKITYEYTDDAVVPVAMARRTAVTLALMGPSYKTQTSRILTECTANDDEAREFAGEIWYVFDPNLSQCGQAIDKEQQAIDAATAKLSDPHGQVSQLEVDRLYIPVTIRLGADKTNKGKSWPEYDRLYAGGVQKDALVLGLVNGFIDHGANDNSNDSGFGEWIDELTGSMDGRDWTLVNADPPIDGSKLPVGKVTTAEAIRAAGDLAVLHWLTLETHESVSVGGAPAKDVTLRILTFFGADSDFTPHKYAIKNSDVFIYNGHSYIGYGPLDPKNFTASDFPASYQILFVDGCVSYNYYNKDYIPLKSGGTENLDLITNGLEAPAWRSGYALGQFVHELLDGTQHSYLDLLQAASDTDNLRVVDGEVDNVYDPDKTPIVVTR